MTFINFINIIYTLSALLGITMITHKNKCGFIVFLIAELCMIYIGYKSQQYGVIGMAIIYFFSNIYGWIKWSK